eukprot:TRINITY_DN16798_c0_g2_i1.p1 TRINITY_DN16798_c0_g2~~TRINITY_DN16798_c0_g2_i1.p1  ORF type:complete len:345 (+),score=143.79 TRINITY_DN16798_c0_g2_i1:362-1396(+)
MSLITPVNWFLEALMLKDVDVDPSEEEAMNSALSWSVLKKQDSACSNTVIQVLEKYPSFGKLANMEAEMLLMRDREDEHKLEKGIEISISRGVLEPITAPAVTKIDVKGKTPADVATLIISQLPKSESAGCVVVLQGMSGTGKGTTCSTLLSKLPNSVTWSNGNVFRSLTLLAATHCKQEGIDLQENAEKVLTPENVATWMKMLSFHKVGDKKYDIKIQGLGLDVNVSEVQNTLLKETIVAKNIPTVAEQTQGDVVKFASAALKQMSDDGMNVVLEGRAATVQYVPTPYRFELMMDDTQLLGQRRAAQRVMAGCFEHFKKGGEVPGKSAILRKAKALCDEWIKV